MNTWILALLIIILSPVILTIATLLLFLVIAIMMIAAWIISWPFRKLFNWRLERDLKKLEIEVKNKRNREGE